MEISGPMPAGSPQVMAMAGRRVGKLLHAHLSAALLVVFGRNST
jgi:hypothetical protein